MPPAPRGRGATPAERLLAATLLLRGMRVPPCRHPHAAAGARLRVAPVWGRTPAHGLPGKGAEACAACSGGAAPCPGRQRGAKCPHGGGECPAGPCRVCFNGPMCSVRPRQPRPRLRWPVGLVRVSLHLLHLQGHRYGAHGTRFMPVPRGHRSDPSPGPSRAHPARVHLKGGGRSGGVCTQCAHPACSPCALLHLPCTRPSCLHPPETPLPSTPTPWTSGQPYGAGWGSCSSHGVISVLYSR